MINKKQDLSLWGQESLVNSFVCWSGDLDSDPSSSFTFHVTSGKLQPFLGCKNIIIPHSLLLASVNKAHVMSQWAVAGFYSPKGLLGAWPILLHWDSRCGQVPAPSPRHFRHRVAEVPHPQLYSTRPESRWIHLNIHIPVGLYRSYFRPLFFYFPLLSESSVVSPYYFYA